MWIEFDKVGKQYDKNIVLKDLNWAVGENEIWQVTGPSGCGKTTFLRLLMGLEKPTKGRIIRNKDVRFSAVFQENRLCEHLDTIQNIKLVCPDCTYEKLVEEALKLLPKEESLFIPTRELSGGMKRRVAVLRAMLADSDIVIFDEPFTGLDKENIEAVNQYICEHRNGRTFIFVSHQEPLVMRERIMVRTLELG